MKLLRDPVCLLKSYEPTPKVGPRIVSEHTLREVGVTSETGNTMHAKRMTEENGGEPCSMVLKGQYAESRE